MFSWSEPIGLSEVVCRFRWATNVLRREIEGETLSPRLSRRVGTWQEDCKNNGRKKGWLLRPAAPSCASLVDIKGWQMWRMSNGGRAKGSRGTGESFEIDSRKFSRGNRKTLAGLYSKQTLLAYSGQPRRRSLQLTRETTQRTRSRRGILSCVFDIWKFVNRTAGTSNEYNGEINYRE